MGMKAITDGEFRRDYFHLDFLKKLASVSVSVAIDVNPNAKVAKNDFTPPILSVTGKLKTHKRHSGNRFQLS
jgi:5-methyltetrahydropteroyltriglutamate--homocysteine methyltransferase